MSAKPLPELPEGAQLDDLGKCPQCGHGHNRLMDGYAQRRCGKCGHQWPPINEVQAVDGRRAMLEARRVRKLS